MSPLGSSNHLIVLKWGTYFSHLAWVHVHVCAHPHHTHTHTHVCNTQGRSDSLTDSGPSAASMQPPAELALSR